MQQILQCDVILALDVEISIPIRNVFYEFQATFNNMTF